MRVLAVRDIRAGDHCISCSAGLEENLEAGATDPIEASRVGQQICDSKQLSVAGFLLFVPLRGRGLTFSRRRGPAAGEARCPGGSSNG